VDPTAHHEVALDRQAARLRRGDEVVDDLVGDGLVERALVAVRPQVELQALELDAQLIRHVADAQRGEVRLARARAQARELRALEADLVIAPGVGVGKRLERARRLIGHESARESSRASGTRETPRAAQSARGAPSLVSGVEVCAQAWHRDPPDLAGFGTGLSNAIQFRICP
jgi:hypothetical protein